MSLTKSSGDLSQAAGDTGTPDVSILIVAYNSADLIAACIGAIPAACRQFSHEVLLVDNGDGATEALVAAKFADTIIVPSRGNIGFAAGNNLLAQAARSRFLLLLNPDLEMQPGALDALLRATREHSSAAAWGGVTVDRSDTPDLGNSVHVPSLLEMASRVVGRSIAGRGSPKGIRQDEQVEALSGGFVLFDRDAWDEAGGLDERYFLYCEEVDLFHRLARKGYTFWRIAAARGYHDIGHGEVHSPMRTLYKTAGNMQFARLHWGPVRRLLAFVLLWLGALQRFVAGNLLGRWRPHWRKLAEANRAIALHPGDWCFGYDKKRGLLCKLAKRRRQR